MTPNINLIDGMDGNLNRILMTLHQGWYCSYEKMDMHGT